MTEQFLIGFLIPWWGWLIVGVFAGASIGFLFVAVTFAGSKEDEMFGRK